MFSNTDQNLGGGREYIIRKNMSNQIVIRQQHIRRLLMSNFQLHRNLMLIGKVANILTFLILCNDLTSIMFLCLKVLCFLKLKSLWEQRLTFFSCHGTTKPTTFSQVQSRSEEGFRSLFYQQKACSRHCLCRSLAPRKVASNKTMRTPSFYCCRNL